MEYKVAKEFSSEIFRWSSQPVHSDFYKQMHSETEQYSSSSSFREKKKCSIALLLFILEIIIYFHFFSSSYTTWVETGSFTRQLAWITDQWPPCLHVCQCAYVGALQLHIKLLLIPAEKPFQWAVYFIRQQLTTSITLKLKKILILTFF